MKRKMVLLISAAMMAMCFTQVVMADEDVIIAEEASQTDAALTAEGEFVTAIETVDETNPVAESTSIVDSGTCGENLTWTLDSDGVLTISGSGAMYDYEYKEYEFVYDDEVYDFDGSTAPWGEHKNYPYKIASVILEDGVISIGDYAFSATSLASVVIPDGVISIGDYAFSSTYLTNIVIPDSVVLIGEGAFSYCTRLKEVSLPNSLSYISDYTFSECCALEKISIPVSVKSIGVGVFVRCEELDEIIIPNTVTSIGDYAFEDCDDLKEIIIPDSVTSIGEFAFWNCDELEKVVIGNGVTTLSSYLFKDCYHLTGLTIPSSVTTICPGIIENTAITDISIPFSVTVIEEYAFGSINLQSITIYNPMVSIPDSAIGYARTEEYIVTLPITIYGYSDSTAEVYASREEAFAFISLDSSSDVTGELMLDEDDIYRYYENGEFVSDYSGLVSYDGSLFFITDGLINTSVNGLCQYEDTWYYAANGQVQTQYTDLALYDGSWFFITEGILDTSKIGLVPYDGEMFLVADGQLLSNYNGLWQNATSIGGDDKWYFIAAGMVQNVSQVVMYDGEFFVVENGILDSDYNGTIEYDGTTFNVVNGQLYS